MKGRPICQDTKLGQLIYRRGIAASSVAAACGFSPRTLTEYVAGRRIIREPHLIKLCEFFGLEAEDIVNEEITEDLTDSTGMPVNKTITSVKDLPKATPTFVKEKAGEATPNLPAIDSPSVLPRTLVAS